MVAIPSSNDSVVTQDQVSDHPSRVINIDCVSGWTSPPCQAGGENVQGTIKHDQHRIVVRNDMPAVAVNSS